VAVSKKGTNECPIDSALTVIDGRWKGTILWRLQDGPMRTAELRLCWRSGWLTFARPLHVNSRRRRVTRPPALRKVPMASNPQMLELLEKMLNSGKTPEEVCRDCLELLPEVRQRWQEFQLIDVQIRTLLPGLGTGPGRPISRSCCGRCVTTSRSLLDSSSAKSRCWHDQLTMKHDYGWVLPGDRGR
jgi:hypothetical protein